MNGEAQLIFSRLVNLIYIIPHWGAQRLVPSMTLGMTVDSINFTLFSCWVKITFDECWWPQWALCPPGSLPCVYT